MDSFYEAKLEGKSRGQIIDPNNPKNARIMAGEETGELTYIEADIDVGVRVFCKSQPRAEAELTKWFSSAEKDKNLLLTKVEMHELKMKDGKRELQTDRSDVVAAKLFSGKTEKLSEAVLDQLEVKGGKKGA